MLGVMRAPDVAGPGEVLMTGTPPGASLVAELEESERKSRCNDEPRPKVADSIDESWLLRHREEEGVRAAGETPASLRKAGDHYKTPSFVFTASLTVRPSAFLPARAACTAFITFPISCMDAAPVSAMAAATACSISS